MSRGTLIAPRVGMKIEYRAALPDDSPEIARFICMAGGGVYEFLFDDLVPFVSAVQLLSWGIASENCESYPVSFRNCFVAIESTSGEFVGVANAFPADRLKEQTYGALPAERQELVRSMVELQDWGSMFLNALAVSEKYRGRGVGARLLNWARGRTEAAGFERLSLHVWADNAVALDFYKARGFVALGVAHVASHPRLMHTGGSILMRQLIEAENAHH